MVHDWLRPICTKVRGDNGILDGFDSEFYLRFDCSEYPEESKSKGTCDILIESVGDPAGAGIRVVANANRIGVLKFLYALGMSRFSKETQQAIEAMNSPLSTANA